MAAVRAGLTNAIGRSSCISASRFELEPDRSLFAAAPKREFNALSDPKIVKPGEQITDSGNRFAIERGNDVPGGYAASCTPRRRQPGTFGD